MSSLFSKILNPIRSAFVAPAALSRSFQTTATALFPNRDHCKHLEKRNIRDHKRRLLAAKYELQRKLHKSICFDPALPVEMRDKHRIKLSKLPRNSAFARLRNRCILTGRPRAVYQKFRMSRICFRKLANGGELMGVKKASW